MAIWAPPHPAVHAVLIFLHQDIHLTPANQKGDKNPTHPSGSCLSNKKNPRSRTSARPQSFFAPAHFFLLGNLGCPILSPRRMTLSTRSMLPSSFWSGVAVPRSKSAMMVGVLLHFVARSFCVMVVPLSFLASERALEMAWPITVPTVLGLMMSSERSTLVRRWPSVLPDLPTVSELYYMGTFATRTQV